MFLQLDNYKAFQFSEQEINDMKIRSYLKTVVLCTSTHPPLEVKLNSEDSPEGKWEGKRYSVDSNECVML